MSAGPLCGVRAIELGGIGPAPFCGQLLADYGADVIVVDKPAGPYPAPPEFDVTRRGKRAVELDLKSRDGVDVVRTLAREADLIFEGFRPGVAERLGLGPHALMADNPALVYGRVTGWGQTGPLARRAGHDINYAALSGALYSCGEAGRRPNPPLNLLADYAGGAMMLLAGLLAALHQAGRTGRGQVIDCAMADGANVLMSVFYGLQAAGDWRAERGVNDFDGGAPFYRCYQARCGGWLAVGALEESFYHAFLDGLDLHPDGLPDRSDARRWPALERRFAEIIKTKTVSEWLEIYAERDACVSEVIDFNAALTHPHARARARGVSVDGLDQPAPAPLFESTPAEAGSRPRAGADTDSILSEMMKGRSAWKPTS